MPRKILTQPAPAEIDADQMRRRFRKLELRLCVPCVDVALHPDAAREGKRIEAIGEQLRREVADVDDPAERLALAEAAYLSVFKRLPWGSA